MINNPANEMKKEAHIVLNGSTLVVSDDDPQNVDKFFEGILDAKRKDYDE